METRCRGRARPLSPRTRRSAGSRRPFGRSRSIGRSRSAMSAASTSPRERPSPCGTATRSCPPSWPSFPSSSPPEVVPSSASGGDEGSQTVTEPRHTNRLAGETSPYLLQHAHNPVDWYPWGDEALERARREDRPVLLSVGYSACHWCHVMERESF